MNRDDWIWMAGILLLAIVMLSATGMLITLWNW